MTLKLSSQTTIITVLLFPLLFCEAKNSLRSLSQFASTFENDGQAEAFSVVTTRQLQTRANATLLPRDYYIDKATGLAYIMVPGSNAKGKKSAELYAFQPHDHGRGRRLDDEEEDEDLLRHLKGTTDTIPPSISNVSPAAGATVGNTFTVQATITDNVKVKGATVRLVNTATSVASTFSLSLTTNNIWSLTVQAKTLITLQMTITATDTSGKTTTTSAVTFTAGSSGGGGGSGGGNTTITNSQWTTRTAPISRAAGRILFDMPDSLGYLNTYVCSGTLVQLPPGATVDRSIVMTAAHCVYEDVVKAFARNVLFIPQQDDGGTDPTDFDCTNDALGCIALDYGFVSDEWASRSFPANIGVDYGFYVSRSLVTNVKGKTIGVGGDIVPMVANFGTPTIGNWTYAMGYSYSNDPKFMYSYEKLGTVTAQGALLTNNWLGSSGLSGGASGGPWTQNDPYSTTGVSIMATNSWGYIGLPGIASSPCNTGGAACVYSGAVAANLATITGNGQVVSCNI